MAYTVIQAGSSLYFVDANGVLAPLTLPSGVSLSASVPPRFEVFKNYAIMVNSPSRPITIDGNGIVRVLCPNPPTSAITLSGATGSLSGTYEVEQTFIIQDASGNTIAESYPGPVSNQFTVSSQALLASGINTSLDTISGTNLYRTTTNGTTFFPWVTINGNTQTSYADSASDASLGLIPIASLGTPPSLTLIAQWRDRLWGVGATNIDTLSYSEADAMWAWPSGNDFTVPGSGTDTFGVTALLPRRDALGVGRLSNFSQVVGNTPDDFQLVKLSENLGVVAQESALVYKDTAFFLWLDGVYTWDSNGIACISDGKGGIGNVRSWFTTSNYFNTTQFKKAFAQIIPTRNAYRLFLCSAGSSSIDSWVEYSLSDGTWWGPHKTGAFSPSAAIPVVNAVGQTVPMIASTSGFIYQEQATRTDDVATPIAFDVTTKRYSANTPDLNKVYGEVTMEGVVQPQGQLAITASVGELNAPVDNSLTYDLTKARQRLGRLGAGKFAQLRFQESTAGQDVIMTGYEIPFTEIGRR